MESPSDSGDAQAKTETSISSQDDVELGSASDVGEKSAVIPEVQAQDPNSVRPIHGWQWFLVIAAIYSTAFLYGLDTTITADVQPAIIETFGQVGQLTWVGVGFPLGSVATILPIGYAFGIFNIKYFYLLSVIIFGAGSALCGAAPNMNALIVGRVIAGAGGAGMYLGVLNYVAVFTSLRERSLYSGLIGFIWGIGTIVGPVVGGGFASSSATWRWSFYINVVLLGLFAPALIFLAPQFQPRPGVSFLEKLMELDWFGIVLIASIFSLYVVALTFGGIEWAWNDNRFIAVIVVFGVLFITFIITQYFAIFTTKERRIFPGQFLRQRSIVLLYLGTAASASAIFVAVYYIPIFFQFAHNDTAIEASLRLFPFMMVTIFFVMVNGALLPVFGYYMPWYLLGGVFITVGASLMYTVNSETGKSNIYGYSILMAIGAGSIVQAGYSIAVAKVKPHEIQAAIGFINIAQLGSATISLTISGSIFQNVAFSNLEHILAGQEYSQEEIRTVISGTTSIVFQNMTPELKEAALKGIVQAMSKVYILVIASGGLIIISSCFMKMEKLFGKA